MAGLFVAGLIPILPVMVIVGYQFEIIEALHLRGKGSYPDFDFKRLLPYLMRGVWPILVRLVVSLPFGILVAVPLLICYFGFFISFITAANASKAGGGDYTGPIIWAVLFGCSFLLALVLGVFLELLLIPMTLRAGLMRDFGAAFSWEFIRDFNRRVWREMLLTELFLIVTGLVMDTIGLLLLIVGAVAANAWRFTAQGYLLCEIYEQYLKQGGTEIPLQVETPPPPTDYVEDEE
jgi:hypothetical protein